MKSIYNSERIFVSFVERLFLTIRVDTILWYTKTVLLRTLLEILRYFQPIALRICHNVSLVQSFYSCPESTSIYCNILCCIANPFRR